MTIYPMHLTDFPNMHSSFPFHLTIHTVRGLFPSHHHNYIECSYVVSGKGWEAINGRRHEMRQGTFTFVLQYQNHEVFGDPSDPLVLYNCSFGMNLLFESGGDMGLRNLLFKSGEDLVPYLQFQEKQQKIIELFHEMHEEYKSNGIWRKPLIKAKLLEILILFDRQRRQGVTLPQSAQVDHPTRTDLWEIIHYIHEHYQENITLGEIASEFNFSISYLSEVFKRLTGNHFVSYIHDLRLRHACGLLSATDMRMADIAEEAGYGSYKTFVRVFQQRKGMSPNQYRKQSGAEVTIE